MVNILTKPKNALCKQYAKLFEMDGVTLEFAPEALSYIAQTAIERKSGARGLRSVIEKILLGVMYDTPSRQDVAKVIITEAAAKNLASPTVEYKAIEPPEPMANLTEGGPLVS